MSAGSQSSSMVTLPPGVVIQPGRETSQTTATGQIEQGMLFPISLPSGSTTSIFIPYTAIHDTAYVQGLIAERVQAIMAISG